MMHNTSKFHFHLWAFALLLIITTSIGIVSLLADSANAAKTNPAKTGWYSIGNDRFRTYDAGGKKGHIEIILRIPITPFAKSFKVEWDAGPPEGGPGPSPYMGLYGPAWPVARGAVKESNINYAQKVDWPVTVIFRNRASIERVKDLLREAGFDNHGSKMYMSLADSPSAGQGDHLWDKDGGLKESKCSNNIPLLGPEATNHIRLYADSEGAGPVGNRNDRMVNISWGFYVLGTTHIDELECTFPNKAKFGWSEHARANIFLEGETMWGRWNRDGYPGVYLGNEEGIGCDRNGQNCRQYFRREGNHLWESNGTAQLINIGKKPKFVQAAAFEDPEGEDPEEEPPLPEPAIDGDVDGDDKADLVALNTASGAAHTFRGSDGSSKSTAFGGGMNSALFDGVEHHVIDVADVDADGYSDLVTLSFNSPLGVNNVVCVFHGQSDGSFGAGILARGQVVPGTFGPSGHEPIGVADVTGDLRADLVTFYAPQGNVYVYPGLANGQFGDGMTFGGGQVNSALFDREGTFFVDVKDVSGDGRADLVGMSAHGPYNSYGAALTYEGTAQGIKQWPTQIHPQVDPVMSDGSGNEPIGLGDVDGDGKAELVVLNSSGSVDVYAGMHALDSATQTYQFLSKTPVNSLSSLNSSLMDAIGDDFVTLFDKTGDGKDDLVKVAENGTVSVAPGQADLKFGSFAQWVTGVTSNRFNIGSYELLQEKPFFRRWGCAPVGCTGRPQAVESDVDGDRRSDLVTVDRTGTAHTYRAIGGREHVTSLLGSVDLALYDGTGHHLIDMADVNGDLRTDKVTLTNSGSVYVYPGRADGQFAAGVASLSGALTPGPLSSTGFEPIAVADVTGDGRADLIVNQHGEGLKVYPGGTGWTFGSPVTTSGSGNSALFDQKGAYYLDAADVTGDKRADLVVMNTNETLLVMKGNANGEFTIVEHTAMLSLAMDNGAGHEPIGIADVNGDGFADLTTLINGTVHVYAGKSTGKFQTEDYSGPSPSGTSFGGSMDSNLFDEVGDEIVGLLDENGDQRADLVTVREDGTVRVYAGKTDFTFGNAPKVRVLPDFSPNRFNYTSGHQIVVEKPLVARAGCEPNGCKWPPLSVGTEFGEDSESVHELVTVDADGTAHMLRGGQSGFAAESVVSLEEDLDPALVDGDGHYVIDTGDVDDDDVTDLITMEDGGKVFVHRGQGDGTFGQTTDTGISLPPVMNGAGNNEPIAVSDVNGDGYDDLVAFVGPGSGYLAVYVGQSNGKFATSAIQSLSGTHNSAAVDQIGMYFLDVVDVTGNRLADLVAVQGSTLYVFGGQANGKFASAKQSSFSFSEIMSDGSGNEPIGFGDVNGDGRADLLVNSFTQNLTLYRGRVDGSFRGGTVAYPGTFDSSLRDQMGSDLLGLIDYNGDGLSDLVAVTDAGDLRTYAANKDGSLDAPVTQEASLSTVRHSESGHEVATEKPFMRRPRCRPSGCHWPPTLPAPSDVDGDGDSDLVTLQAAGTAKVYAGTPGGFDLPGGTSSFAGSMNPALRDESGRYVIDVADVDGNGRDDFVTVDDDGDVFVAPGQANRTFGTDVDTLLDLPPVMSGAGQNEPIAVADVTGDKRGDLIAFVGPGTGSIKVYAGQSNGKFSTSPVQSLNEAVNSALADRKGIYFLDADDTGGDDSADLVAIRTSDWRLVTFGGQTSGQFSAGGGNPIVKVVMRNGVGEEPVGLGDVDADGTADLVTLDSDGHLKLYSSPSSSYPVSAYEGTIDSSLLDGEGEDLVGLLDYDGDERADLVSVNDEEELLVYKAKVGGGFAEPVVEEGTLASIRHETSGEEPATEKPFLRKTPCEETGCEWPWTPEPEPEPEPETSDWTPMDSGGDKSRLADVWCDESSSQCLSVGYSTSKSGAERARASMREGGSWFPTWVMEPSEAESIRFMGIDCWATAECMVVGSVEREGVRQGAVFNGDGFGWYDAYPEMPEGAESSELTKVACASSSWCMAVGHYVDSEGTKRGLSMRWDGESWTNVPTIGAPPAAVPSSEMTDISCVSSTNCVGTTTFVLPTTGQTKGALLGWDGSAWNTLSTVGMGDGARRELSGVSCESATCVAVGSYLNMDEEERTWILARSGSTWSTVSSPNPAGSDTARLTDVSCSGTNKCVALGRSGPEGKAEPLSLVWNGTTWSEHAVGLPAGAVAADPAAVFCPPEGECQAVGSASYSDGPRAASYSGDGSSWSPIDTGILRWALSGISCTSSTACKAVGNSTQPFDEAVSAHAWTLDGSEWTRAPGLDPVEAFRDVSCAAVDVCVAVGQYVNGSPTPLADLWTGSEWTWQSVPKPSGAGGALDVEGVSCASTTSCLAAGWYWQTSPARYLPFSLKWNGSTWSLVTVPTPGTPAATYLRDIACTSATSCVAVGSYTNGSGVPQALIESWNGTAWTVQTPPNPSGAVESVLRGVSCTSASACTAVGTYKKSTNGAKQAHLLRWNGTAWSLQSASPPSGATAVDLADIACYSASGCVAVGSYATEAGSPALALRWNGSAWAAESTPPVAAGVAATLDGVSCSTEGDCVAVGKTAYEGGHVEELTMEKRD